MITRAITSGISRFWQRLNPPVVDKGNEIAILKPFGNPSRGTDNKLTETEKDTLIKEIISKLNLGHNIVAIDVGKMHIEDFLFSQPTIGSNITTFLSDPSTLQMLSRETERRMSFIEGAKRVNKDGIDFNHEHSLGWEQRGTPETFYAVLVKSIK